MSFADEHGVVQVQLSFLLVSQDPRRLSLIKGKFYLKCRIIPTKTEIMFAGYGITKTAIANCINDVFISVLRSGRAQTLPSRLTTTA